MTENHSVDANNMVRRLSLAGQRWFHFVIPDGAVYVGRHYGGLKRSPFCNPYPLSKYTLAESRDLFRTHVLPGLDCTPLRGLDLACACKPDAEWCHANDLIKKANRGPAKDNPTEGFSPPTVPLLMEIKDN